jgi:hypothetical protein
MRDTTEDAEVTDLLREHDRIIARLGEMGVTGFHKRPGEEGYRQYPELRDLRWAPYREFGIPDPGAEEHEAPAGPVVIRSVGYRDGDIIAYWEQPEPGTRRLPPVEHMREMVRELGSYPVRFISDSVFRMIRDWGRVDALAVDAGWWSGTGLSDSEFKRCLAQARVLLTEIMQRCREIQPYSHASGDSGDDHTDLVVLAALVRRLNVLMREGTPWPAVSEKSSLPPEVRGRLTSLGGEDDPVADGDIAVTRFLSALDEKDEQK